MADRDSISIIYRRHAPTVFRRAQQILGNSADAHEVVQDVFLSLFENPAQFAGLSALTTFLYGMTTHTCLNRLRNQRNRARLLAENLQAAEEDPAGLTAEQLLILQRALATMPDELAQVAVYSCMDGLSQEEIARILSCSRRHVGNLLERVNEWGKSQEANPC
jgi:RNA polymerase sigma-70 factor (ECF subfamily)